MKQAFIRRVIYPSLLLVAMTSVALLGFVTYGHGTMHDDLGCIASKVNGVSCAAENVSSVSGHVTALNSFLRAISSGALYLLAVFSVVAAIIAFLFLPSPGDSEYAWSHKAPVSRRRLLSWISLFEQSPSL